MCRHSGRHAVRRVVHGPDSEQAPDLLPRRAPGPMRAAVANSVFRLNKAMSCFSSLQRVTDAHECVVDEPHHRVVDVLMDPPPVEQSLDVARAPVWVQTLAWRVVFPREPLVVRILQPREAPQCGPEQTGGHVAERATPSPDLLFDRQVEEQRRRDFCMGVGLVPIVADNQRNVVHRDGHHLSAVSVEPLAVMRPDLRRLQRQHLDVDHTGGQRGYDVTEQRALDAPARRLAHSAHPADQLIQLLVERRTILSRRRLQPERRTPRRVGARQARARPPQPSLRTQGAPHVRIRPSQPSRRARRRPLPLRAHTHPPRLASTVRAPRHVLAAHTFPPKLLVAVAALVNTSVHCETAHRAALLALLRVVQRVVRRHTHDSRHAGDRSTHKVWVYIHAAAR